MKNFLPQERAGKPAVVSNAPTAIMASDRSRDALAAKTPPLAPSKPGKELDRIDRRILRILQKDASVPIATIADQVGLSQTPCWKRIRRLELDGVIEKRVALLNPEKIGLGLTVFVSLQAPDHSEGWLASFAERVSTMAEVMEFYRMAGDVDYMLRVVVADMTSYDAFYKRLIATVPLKNVTSRFAMERIKLETAYELA